MKKAILLSGLVLGLATGAQAGLMPSATYSPGVLVPDGTYSGLTETLTSSGSGTITGVSLQLNVSGGYNGNLYAYLSYCDGNTANTIVLLNQMGNGTSAASGSGFSSVTLADGAYANISGATPRSGNPVTGTYNPDCGGGDVIFSSTFGGMDANGTWTLFIADLNTGGQSTLNGWSLDVTAVPEPVNVALGVFGGMACLIGGLRWRLRRNHALK